jgi:hypothetical protein
VVIDVQKFNGPLAENQKNGVQELIVFQEVVEIVVILKRGPLLKDLRRAEGPPPTMVDNNRHEVSQEEKEEPQRGKAEEEVVNNKD